MPVKNIRKLFVLTNYLKIRLINLKNRKTLLLSANILASINIITLIVGDAISSISSGSILTSPLKLKFIINFKIIRNIPT